MAFTGDDLFEILNEDGTPTGITKKRALVHRDGDLHGASHIFVTRLHQGRIQVLLQKRSQDKDSFPGWLDTSSAGHLDPGESFDQGAQRELSEELGLTGVAPRFLFIQHQDYEKVFHGEVFHDREIDYVYMIELDQPEEAFQIEACELQSVHWLDARNIVSIIDSPDNDQICILPLEFHRLIPHLEEYYGITI